METSVKQLREDVFALGICPGDTVMVHASYKSLGSVEDGAAGIFRAFDGLLGEKGTLLLPGLSYSLVTEKNPLFDLRNTPTCVGYLPEYFRTKVDGVVRSMHATHSICAKGRLAKELICGHEKDLTPVGVHSPLRKLRDIGGKILFLGCSADHNTSMHGVEETAEPFYLFDRTKTVHYILRDGDTVIEQDALRHNFVVDGHLYDQRYSRVVPLLDTKDYAVGKVANADCTVISSPALWRVGKEALLRAPSYFVVPL